METKTPTPTFANDDPQDQLLASPAAGVGSLVLDDLL